MSAIKLTYLYCDGENCPRGESDGEQPFKIDPLPEEGPQEQRAAAKLSGWVRSYGKDYCPLCAKTSGKVR